MSKAPSPYLLPEGEGFQILTVRAPCRLHFGMFSFGRTDVPQCGGVGVMIDPPVVEVSIEPADELQVCGKYAERARQFVQVLAVNWQLPVLPTVIITADGPSDHIGLGVGTQLGLSVAAGLRRFLGLPELSIQALAQSVSRGRRSAVGSYGFKHGGLIVDAGHRAADAIAPLGGRVALPEEWRFVLVRPIDYRGLTGQAEVDAFSRLPAVPMSTSRELQRIAEQEIVPAAEAGDCAAFGDAVYRFGILAGECFAPVQGGPFATPQLAELVAAIRGLGIAGVGQSSWGPTIFALTASAAEAAALDTWLRERHTQQDLEISIAQPNNTGALISGRCE